MAPARQPLVLLTALPGRIIRGDALENIPSLNPKTGIISLLLKKMVYKSLKSASKRF
jgi:hypothetical protein